MLAASSGRSPIERGPCCIFATSKEAWLEEPMNHQGLPQGRRGFRVTASEPNSLSAARKHMTERGVFKHAWHEASALCNVTARKHLPLMATAHVPGAMGKTSHPALPEQALPWMLPRLSLFPPSQRCQANSIPKSIFSLTSATSLCHV